MELKIDNNVIEQLVKEQVKATVAAALATKSDYLIRQLVDAAMNEKDPHSYGRSTLLESSINKLIREEASTACKEWLDTKRAEIRKQVFAALSKKSDGLVAKVVEQLVVSLGEKLRVQAYLERND